MASVDSQFSNGRFGAHGITLGASKPVSGVISSDIAGAGMFENKIRGRKNDAKK